MKKKMIALLAGALMFAAMAGNALAYFEQGNLVRVVYDKTTMTEVATDLGNVNSIISAAGTNFYGTGADSYLSGALAGSSLENLSVAYFTVNVANKDLWLSSKNDPQNLNGYTGWSAGSSAMSQVLNLYKADGDASYSGSMSNLNSYWYKLDGNGTKVGNFNTFLKDGAGEISLAALATGGDVALNLFSWDTPNVSTGLVGTKSITLYTLADGSTKVTTTPIPPAFFLMGSGLLGMIGLRRRMS